MKNERNLNNAKGLHLGRALSLRATTASLTFVWICVAFISAFGADSEAQTPKIVTVRVAADSQNLGYEAYKAFDGDPETFWHSEFSQAPFEPTAIPIYCGYSTGCVDDHPKRVRSRKYSADRPFELRADLGGVYELTGVRYTPRSDGNENGSVADYEVYALESVGENSASPDIPESELASDFDSDGVWNADLGEPVASGSLDGKAGLVRFNAPVKARYVVFRVKREFRDQKYASAAELEILSDGARFLVETQKPTEARKIETADALRAACELTGASAESLEKSPYFLDLTDQFNRLVEELGRPEYYEAIASQTPTEQAGLMEGDRDPADVVLRRTRALWLSLREVDEEEFADGSEIDGLPLRERAFFEKLASAAEKTPIENVAERFKLFLTAAFTRRALMLERSELDFESILFVKRNRSNYSHICDQFYGRSAMPGGGLYVLSRPFGRAENALELVCSAFDSDETAKSLNSLWTDLYCPETRDLLANSTVVGESRLSGKRLEDGAFIAPELSFDAKKIAFAWCECKGSAEHVDTLDLSRGHTQEGRCYHIFTCNADGSELREVTDGTWNDIDPCFLPNGRIAFISERRGGYLRCGRDCPNYTLFDMNPDGSKIRPLSYHETNEWAPSVSNGGQILWTRWDYIDRFGCIAHGAWTTTPDGRNPRAVCGNYAPRHYRPDSVMDIRAIPGSKKLIATAGPHHGQSFGSIIEIDPNAPDDPISPIIRMTPDVGFPESQNGSQVWGTPWPLAEDLFLAVADYSFDIYDGREGGRYFRGDYGIYLADAFGNRELIYRDPEIGASTPIPFIARETPPVVPGLVDEKDITHTPYVTPPPFDGPRPQAVVAIQNVYAADLPIEQERKAVAIRVVQVFCMSVPSGRPPYEIGVREATATDSVKLARRVWGVAPVEEDGSACFYVPANCELYFQTLDADGVVIRSMRSGLALRPDERLSCVGCHEPRETASAPYASTTEGSAQAPIALRREPSELVSEGVGTQPVNFPELVQPILDARCVECHEKEESVAKGAPDMSRKPSHGYYASYWNLASQGFATTDFGDPLRSIPGKFGARASKLYPMLDDHYGVKLTDSERRRIALWLDKTSNFYGVYEKEGCEKEFRGERAVPTLE